MKKFQLNFNNKKCKVLHIGNKNFNYDRSGKRLEYVGFGSYFVCYKVTNRANKMLLIINHNVEYNSEEVMRKPFNNYVYQLNLHKKLDPFLN